MRKEERNGVYRPHAKTLAGEAWKLFDSMGRSFTVKEALERSEALGLNPGNIRTELSNWRKFNGIKM